MCGTQSGCMYLTSCVFGFSDCISICSIYIFGASDFISSSVFYSIPSSLSSISYLLQDMEAGQSGRIGENAVCHVTGDRRKDSAHATTRPQVRTDDLASDLIKIQLTATPNSAQVKFFRLVTLAVSSFSRL